ncbi:MAG: hypothetical protein RLZZ09_629, partial [Pseudomonadota bacterium]
MESPYAARPNREYCYAGLWPGADEY